MIQPHDIVLGKSLSNFGKHGNQVFRMLCWAHRHTYVQGPKDVATSIVHRIQDILREYGATFRLSNGNVCSNVRAVEKIRQTLREQKHRPLPVATWKMLQERYAHVTVPQAAVAARDHVQLLVDGLPDPILGDINTGKKVDMRRLQTRTTPRLTRRVSLESVTQVVTPDDNENTKKQPIIDLDGIPKAPTLLRHDNHDDDKYNIHTIFPEPTTTMPPTKIRVHKIPRRYQRRQQYDLQTTARLLLILRESSPNLWKPYVIQYRVL